MKKKKNQRKRLNRKKRKMMLKSKMKKTKRKRKNQRLRLSLRNTGIMNSKMKIKLFGLEMLKTLKKKNTLSFINSLLKTRMIHWLTLISRLMEE